MPETFTKTGVSHVGFATVQVRDLDAAIAFYCDKLGFAKTTDAPMGPDARWVEVTPPGGNTRLSLIAKGNPAWEEDRIGTHAVTFEVNDFENACAALKAQGVAFHKEPKKEFWGWWAEIEDSSGNKLGLHAE